MVQMLIKRGNFKIVNDILILSLIMIILGLGSSSCSKEEKMSPVLQRSQVSIPPRKFVTEVVKKEKKERVARYEYKGVKYRNPLLPLTAKGIFIEGTSEMTGANLSTLRLKGIIKDRHKRGKLALIDDINGASYIVKDKRLINQQGKMVKGVVGIVKEKSVVLITSDKGIRELKMELGGDNLK